MFRDRAVEEEIVLHHDAELRPIIAETDVGEIVTVDQNLARIAGG